MFRVRRIEQDDVEHALDHRLDRGAGTGIADDPIEAVADDSTAARDAAVREVVGDERARAPIALDEGHLTGAAAQRLDTDRAGARVAVEHPRPVDSRRDHVEERLAQPIGGRPHAVPRRRLQSPPLQRPRDDTHETNLQFTIYNYQLTNLPISSIRSRPAETVVARMSRACLRPHATAACDRTSPPLRAAPPRAARD